MIVITYCYLRLLCVNSLLCDSHASRLTSSPSVNMVKLSTKAIES